jgi:hypothetical protein
MRIKSYQFLSFKITDIFKIIILQKKEGECFATKNSTLNVLK